MKYYRKLCGDVLAKITKIFSETTIIFFQEVFCHVAFYIIFNDVTNIATKLQVTLPGFRIPVDERYIYFLPKRPDWLLGPPSLQRLQGFFLVGKIS
jgi:hypothetical protein